jgi:CheY-like chemotaxis protein
MISVEDDGVGMTDDVVQHIFEPFFTTKPVGKGTGLGLASVDGLVSQMKGFVTVHSVEGTGTIFKVFLPAAEGVAEGPEEHARGICVGRGETILVCEDDSSVRKVTYHILKNAGYEVLEACDGDEALTMIREAGEGIGLLVTDLVMPGMNGQELAEQAAAASPGLPTIFVSGYASTDFHVSLTPEQKEGFLRKPFEGADLLSAVRAALDARAAGKKAEPA